MELIMACKVIVTLKTGGVEEFLYGANDIVGCLAEYEADPASASARENAENVQFQITAE